MLNEAAPYWRRLPTLSKIVAMRLRFVRRSACLLFAGLSLLTIAPAAAAQSPEPLPPLLAPDQRTAYKRAFDALDAGRWDEAKRLAAEAQDKLGEKLFRWIDLQLPRSGASFED